MSRWRATDPIRVSLGECECPGTPHEEDEAWIPATLPPGVGAEGSAILARSEQYANEQELQRDITLAFCRAVERWNLEDDGPVPVSRVLDLKWPVLLRIAGAVSAQYMDELIAPFLPVRPESSPPGQTEASTSPTPESSEPSPER